MFTYLTFAISNDGHEVKGQLLACSGEEGTIKWKAPQMTIVPLYKLLKLDHYSGLLGPICPCWSGFFSLFSISTYMSSLTDKIYVFHVLKITTNDFPIMFYLARRITIGVISLLGTTILNNYFRLYITMSVLCVVTILNFFLI